MTPVELLIQQLLNGLTNGMIIALIAIGYSIVYGVVELINFAHGDLVMLGAFLALTLVGLMGIETASFLDLLTIILSVAIFCGFLNKAIDFLVFKPIRKANRLTQLVSAIGVSFILLNLGLLWGGLPLPLMGNAAAASKDFPTIIPFDSFFNDSQIQFGYREVLVFVITIPILSVLSYLVSYSRWGLALRAVAQDPLAAELVGVNVNRTISGAFFVGGALGGVGGVIYALYYGTINFQMGYRIGLDGFTAAVLGGIGSLAGATVGGLLIGILRALSDQYISLNWTNLIVFLILIFVLIIKPNGLLGRRMKIKV